MSGDLRSARRAPTMRDVAAEAGVSLKTVSRVMNGVTTVDPELAERVAEAVDRLGFVTNLAASGLRRLGKPSNEIGAIWVADPLSTFLGSLLDPIQSVAASQSSMLLASTVTKDSGLEEDFVRAFVARRVAGIILAPSAPSQKYLARFASDVPFVCVDRPATGVETDLVMATNYGGGFEAVTHLIEHGHTRIGYIGDLEAYVNTTERYTGYRAAMSAAGITAQPSWIRHGVRTAEAAQQAAVEVLEQPDPPTALFTSQAALTFGTLKALNQLGLVGKIAHIGFDDVPLADVVRPGLTVVAQDVQAMGTRAAEMLFERIHGSDAPFRRVDVPTKLILRGSGELPPLR